VQVWVWEGKCEVARPTVAQDRHVCIFRMARNLEGDLRACREESGWWMWRVFIPRSDRRVIDVLVVFRATATQ